MFLVSVMFGASKKAGLISTLECLIVLALSSNGVSVEALQDASNLNMETLEMSWSPHCRNGVYAEALHDASTSQHENTDCRMEYLLKLCRMHITSQHENTGNELVTTVSSNGVFAEALHNASTSQRENPRYPKPGLGLFIL
ncbi:hypothetical protein Tco_0745744 [Tanacetum coccineum]